MTSQTVAPAPFDTGPVDRVAAARAGDAAAFEGLYRELQPKLLRYAYALVGNDAEDVTAEAWLQIARDIAGFDGDEDDFRGWTATIVRNRATDFARARARRPAQPTGLHALLDSPTADTESIASENLSTAAAIALISSLPKDQAEAVLLRAVVGLDAASAGRVLGKRPGAVRVAAHRGLKALARQLADESDA